MKKLFFNLFLASMLSFGLVSCGGGNAEQNNQQDTVAAAPVEFDVLATYLESNGNYINSDAAPSFMEAEQVYKQLDSNILVIDIRTPKDFAAGHIKGAVNLKMSELLDYSKANDLSKYSKVVMSCYTGQTASYATVIMRMLGHNNFYTLKWGMSAWSKNVAKEKWLKNTSNKYAQQLDTAFMPKPAKGNYPELTTGLTDPKEILEARASEILLYGFNDANIKIEDLMANPSEYFIVNYWPENLYKKGHLPGAMQYTPKKSLGRDADLSTLPTDKTILVYCHTGQQAAYAAAYLNVMGYNAKILLYGANGFMYDVLKKDAEYGNFFNDKLIKNYPVETSEYKAPEGGEEVKSGC